MTTDTLFASGSCGKAFLSASMRILIDDCATGRNVTPLPEGLDAFDWDTKFASLLPQQWKLMDEWVQLKASLRDILAHDFSYGLDDLPGDIVRNLRNLRPAYELRETWLYNNMMYITGAHIIETCSGTKYVEFVEEHIFRPLDMTDTTFSSARATRSGKLMQNWMSFGRRIPMPLNKDNE